MSASPESFSRMRLYAGADAPFVCLAGAPSVAGSAGFTCWISVCAMIFFSSRLETSCGGGLFAGLTYLCPHLGHEVVLALLDAFTNYVERECADRSAFRFEQLGDGLLVVLHERLA